MKKILFLLLLVGFQVGVMAEPGVWPKTINHEKGVITVYQPQIDSFERNRLEARSAVSVLKTGATDEVFGTVWFSSNVTLDRDNHEAELSQISIDEIVFVGASEENINLLKKILLAEIPQRTMQMSREQLVALVSGIKGDSNSLTMNGDVPQIKYTKASTIVVTVPEKIEEEQIKGVEGAKAIKGSSHYLFKNKSGSV